MNEYAGRQSIEMAVHPVRRVLRLFGILCPICCSVTHKPLIIVRLAAVVYISHR